MDEIIDIYSAEDDATTDLDLMRSWCNEKYEIFAPYFDQVRDLYSRLQDKHRVITDAELEQILTDLPLQLFSVSEYLNQFRLDYEVLKLRIKHKSRTVSKQSSESSQVKRDEEGEAAVVGDKLLMLAYSSIITRVENEISFCRELIMSAKKIWDGRKRAESVNPVKEQSYDSELPSFDVRTKAYVK